MSVESLCLYFLTSSRINKYFRSQQATECHPVTTGAKGKAVDWTAVLHNSTGGFTWGKHKVKHTIHRREEEHNFRVLTDSLILSSVACYYNEMLSNVCPASNRKVPTAVFTEGLLVVKVNHSAKASGVFTLLRLKHIATVSKATCS